MINQEKKKTIWSEIETVINQIKTNSKDAKFADKLIDKLMSLKGQYDIEPTRLFVPEKDVIKEYDNDNLRIVKCKDCIIWQHKGGFTFVVKPTMRALYEYIDGMLAMKDNYESLSDDLRQLYEASYFGMSLILQAPMFAVVDDELFVDLATFIGEGVKKVSDKLLNQPLQEETPIENAEFETKMEVANELLKDGKYTDKNS